MDWTAGLAIEKDEKHFYIQGSGNNREEAIEDCLRQLREHISVFARLAEHAEVPEDILPKVPADLPAGCGLLILDTLGLSDPEKCEWRFFAIPYGTFTLKRRRLSKISGDLYKATGVEEREGECPIGPTPLQWTFFHPDSLYEFPLPEGSQEFVDGVWIPRKAAQYFH